MPSLDIPALIAAQPGRRRRAIILRPINPTASMAQELAAIILPAATIWSGALERIMAAYDPKPLGLIHDSPEEAQTAIEAAASEFRSRLVATITPALRNWVVRAERWHRAKWSGAVKAGTGIELSTVLTAGDVEETLGAFLARNASLIRNISDQAEQRIADAVFRGYQNKTPAREVAKEVREAAGMARARSIRVASDQNAKLAAALDDERRAQAGISQYRWRHSQKLHYRPEHKARDGKIYENGKPAGDTPGQLPFCGCRAQAYIPLEDEMD